MSSHQQDNGQHGIGFNNHAASATTTKRDLTREEMEELAKDKTIIEAAKHLDMSISDLRELSREKGIPRWPYKSRVPRKMRKLISSFKIKKTNLGQSTAQQGTAVSTIINQDQLEGVMKDKSEEECCAKSGTLHNFCNAATAPLAQAVQQDVVVKGAARGYSSLGKRKSVIMVDFNNGSLARKIAKGQQSSFSVIQNSSGLTQQENCNVEAPILGGQACNVAFEVSIASIHSADLSYQQVQYQTTSLVKLPSFNDFLIMSGL